MKTTNFVVLALLRNGTLSEMIKISFFQTLKKLNHVAVMERYQKRPNYNIFLFYLKIINELFI